MRFSNAILAGVFLTSGFGILNAQSPTEIEQHIRQILDAIVPASIVRGSQPTTTKPPDRMAALSPPTRSANTQEFTRWAA
jgi:hypothetical protein